MRVILRATLGLKSAPFTMIISVIERMTFGCPTCSELMTGDIVHVIDSEEQAQLWSHCIQKGFNRLVCRKGHALTPAIPVLAHDRAQRRLVFCPSNGTDDVAGEIEIAESMVARVHKYLPPNLDKTYLNQANGVCLIPSPYSAHRHLPACPGYWSWRSNPSGSVIV